MKRMKVSQNAFIEKSETDLLKRISFRYLPYWPLFILAIIVGLVAGLTYLKYKAPMYSVNASILVKDEKKGLDDSKAEDAFNLFGEKKIIENEIEVLRSRSIISQIVTRLGLYAPIEEKSEIIDHPSYPASLNSLVHLDQLIQRANNRLFTYRSAYLTCPVKIQLENPDSLLYEATRVPFTYNDRNKTIVINDSIYPINQWVASRWGKVLFTRNPAYTQNFSQKPFYFSLVSMPKAIDHVQDAIETSSSSKLSTVINITYKDPVPARGEAIVNELVKCYEQSAISDKTMTAAKTLDFVEKRLAIAGSQLDAVEANVQKYRTASDIVNISQQSNQYLQNVSENDKKLSELDIQLSVLNQIETYIQSKENQPSLVPTTLGIRDPMLTQLLEKLYDSEIEYDKLKRTTAEDNPIMVSIQNEIEKIKPSILENVRNQKRSVQASMDKLVETSAHYNDMLNTLPEKERGLAQISRQQNIENSIYSFLLQKKEEASLAFNAAVSGSRTIDKAQSSTEPLSPKLWMVFLISFLLPIPLVSLAIDARDLLTNKVLFRNTIEASTVIPVIGELGYDKSKKLLAISKDRRTFISEQFRNLRGSVASRLSKQNGQTVMVTSSIAKEGKSFVAINLAVAFAQAGKRTVLIEADMYKPKVASVFQLSNEPGLSDSLKHIALYSTIQPGFLHRTSIDDNLFVVPASDAQGNPSELFMNDSFGVLLKELADKFDIIIIDSVPTNPVPDAFIIGKYADITLYVVRHGVTLKEHLLLLDEDIKMQSLVNVNIVFNGIKRRGIATSGYGYSYGYGFERKTGYGYYGYYSSNKTKTVLS